MVEAPQIGKGKVLTLPWNRLPNYLICVVALVNLIAGIVALYVAYGFAMDIASFNAVIAAVFVGLFGILFIWVAWCFRTGILPVRFIADAERRECGFRWGRWWNGRFDLTNAKRLVGELRFYREEWHWAILLPEDSPHEKDRWIYGSASCFDTEEESKTDCEKVIGPLAEHLSLPFEIRTESDPNDPDSSTEASST